MAGHAQDDPCFAVRSLQSSFDSVAEDALVTTPGASCADSVMEAATKRYEPASLDSPPKQATNMYSQGKDCESFPNKF